MFTFTKRQLTAVIVALTLVFLDLSKFYDFFQPFRGLLDEGRTLAFVVFSLVFLLSLISAFLLLFCERSLLRKMTLPVFIFFFLLNIGFVVVSGSPIDFQQTTLVVDYFQWWAGAVIENYGVAIIPFLILFIPVSIFIERLPDYLKFRIPKKLYFVPLVTLIFVFVTVSFSNAFLDRFPSPFRIPALLLFAAQSEVYVEAREEVDYQYPLEPQAEKIVLIVDESIRADILGINGYHKNTTPYINSLEAGLVSFGLAASASNCSDYSNLVLRTGLAKGEIPDHGQKSMKMASIWQYMRKAGYRTVYLDAQSATHWDNFQNYMNAHEAIFIDRFLRLRQETEYQSDRAARDKLVEFLEQPGKTFIMLNKYGIHFPYFRSYPEENSYFTPALSLGEPMNDRIKSLNSYMNGIRWSVDDWFKGLLAQREEYGDYVIFYTSDHGQNIVDDGTLTTHCRPRAIRYEGVVPMMVFSSKSDLLKRLKIAREESYNKTSHFQVFPSLIRVAGYDEAWVSENFGASLFESPDYLPEFFVGDIHGRGSVRRWVSILPESSEKSQ